MSLRDLAEGAAAGDPAAGRELAGQARAQARDVLAEGRFSDGESGRPFLRGVLSWIGDRFQGLVDGVDVALPGGEVVGWAVILAVVAALAAVLASVVVRRAREEGTRAGAGPVAGAAPDDPAALEREASRAEAAGDHEAAVRLRFRAGLLRLDARRAIHYRPSLTTGQVARELRSPRFDELARAHDAIAYGRRPARDADAAAARDGWSELLRPTSAGRGG